jgi:hypothetical protein
MNEILEIRRKVIAQQPYVQTLGLECVWNRVSQRSRLLRSLR